MALAALPQNPANKISEELERKRKADKDFREGMDADWYRQQAAENEAQRTQAARVAERAKASMAAAATLGPSVSGRGSSSASIPWKSPPSEQQPKADGVRGKPPPPDLPKAGAVAGHFDPAEGSNILVLHHPVPAGPPVMACPTTGQRPAASTFVFATGSLASGDNVWAFGTLGTSSSGAVGPAVKWSGPPSSSRGPELGGVYSPASVAGTVVTSFHPPAGAEGKSTVMRKARDKDRGLQALPKSLFHYVPEEDPPILGVAAGIDGLGWYSKLWLSEQWSEYLYPIATDLPAFDFAHPVSARDPACIRRLVHGHVEYFRFALHLFSGEYVPWEFGQKHENFRTAAVRFHCLQCRKDPCGDHGGRNSHTRGKKFSARASGFANPGLAKVIDFVERQLDQLDGCINATFAEGTGDPRVSMMKFADLKKKATGILQSLLENPGSGDGSDRPFGEHPVGTWVCSWPLDRKARGDASTLVGYFRHFLSSVCYTRNQCWIPYVIVDRLVHTGQLILNSALADMRKLSPGLDLPTVLPNNMRASFWGLMGWTNTPRERMLSVFGDLTTMAAPPLPVIELKPDPWSDATRDALQDDEHDELAHAPRRRPRPPRPCGTQTRFPSRQPTVRAGGGSRGPAPPES